MNVSVWRSTQTHLLPSQEKKKKKISIILNVTVHTSSSERLVIIHSEIKVWMLLVEREWRELYEAKNRPTKQTGERGKDWV